MKILSEKKHKKIKDYINKLELTEMDKNWLEKRVSELSKKLDELNEESSTEPKGCNGNTYCSICKFGYYEQGLRHDDYKRYYCSLAIPCDKFKKKEEK